MAFSIKSLADGAAIRFLMKGRASEGLRAGNAIEVGIEVG
jgi:hypothetical protein